MSGVNPMYRSQPIRMMGMASGMDTDSIIQATLRMHQFKIDNVLRNRKLVEWKQETHNSIKDQITNIRQTYLSNLGAKTMMNRNTFNSNVANATVAGGAKAGAVTVSATVNAGLGNLTINSISQLAKGTSVTSAKSISGDNNGFTTSQTLGSLNLAAGGITFSNYQASVTSKNGASVSLSESQLSGLAWQEQWSLGIESNGVKSDLLVTKGSGGALTFQVDGNTVAATAHPTEANTLQVDVNGMVLNIVTDDEGNMSWYPEQGGEDLAQAMTFDFRATINIGGGDAVELRKASADVPDAIGSAIFSHYNGTNRALSFVGEASFNITESNGDVRRIDLKSNMTISDMINKVNNEVKSVTMSYDRMQDRFVIENKENSNASLSISNTAGGNVINNLFGVANGTDTLNGALGSKAKVRINNEDYEFDSNNFTFRGVNFRLNETSSEAITVSVTRDTDKAVDAIKDFIDSYNMLIKRLEDLLNERKKPGESSYKPLTDEEKSLMTEKQVEEYEAIARKGIMRNDKGIEDLVRNLRSSFFEQIEGTGMTASQLGLSTGNYFGGTGGQIIIDESKLRAALEQDPDKVADVFIRIDYTDGMKGVGLMHKIDNLLRDFVKIGGTQENTLTALEKSFQEINDRIAQMEQRMWAEEDRLYRQFAAMETAMSQMQQQGNWFNAMLGNA